MVYLSVHDYEKCGYSCDRDVAAAQVMFKLRKGLGVEGWGDRGMGNWGSGEKKADG
jgi:hypothetical protein